MKKKDELAISAIRNYTQSELLNLAKSRKQTLFVRF